MSEKKQITKRRMAIAGAGVAALVAGSLTWTSANAAEDAAPSVKSLSVTSASKLASKLTSDIKGDAGSYYDAKAKKLVVNVIDEAAKKQVEAAGAEAKVVEHTMAQLEVGQGRSHRERTSPAPPVPWT